MPAFSGQSHSKVESRMISLDTETTGVDFRHGAKPFFVTSCTEDGSQSFWEWDVDPITRQPKVPAGDIEEIRAEIEAADFLVLQNPKFDATALTTVGIEQWPWDKTFDTLIAGHLLATDRPHDLTSMAAHYLGTDISQHETKLEEAVQEARKIARKEFPEWRIAKENMPDLPSAKEETWRFDYWLPRAVATVGGRWDRQDWVVVLRDYANTDSAATIALWKAMRAEIERRGLWEIYLERLRILPIAYDMEKRGVTLSKTRLEELKTEYEDESDRSGRVCINIAKGYQHDLVLPKSGNNKSLTGFVFGCTIATCPRCKKSVQASLDTDITHCSLCKPDKCADYLKECKLDLDRRENLELTPLKFSKKTGLASLDQEVMDHYLTKLDEFSKPLTFIRALMDKRKRDTAISYLDGYSRFSRANGSGPDWLTIHPNLNPTGTATLRWSSNRPNSQNLSKKEGFNLRYCFGPSPGREWWALDAQNIELRIPAYKSGEEEFIKLFERPNDPPYFGSNHLLVADILHPEKFAECRKEGVSFKDKYPLWYRRVKSGSFSILCGAVEESGTADRAYGVPGAQRIIKGRLTKMAALSKQLLDFAEKHGYIETMPDRTVDPNRGFPVMCSRSEWGKIIPTTPFSYFVQSTAMWWMMRAMVRCYEYTQSLGPDYRICMQVHDEIVVDFPYVPNKGNLPKIRKLRRLMEQGGDDIGVPITCSVAYHPNNYSEGEDIER